MAKQKTNGNGWKGIPANERKAVATIRNFSLAAAKDSPQKVWRELRAHRAATAKKQAEEAKAKAAQFIEEEVAKRQCAKNDIGSALGHMTTTRDLLERLAEGEDYGFPVSELVHLLHVGVVDSMSRMESALVDLGIVDKDAEFFVERPRTANQEEVAHG